MAIGWSTVVVLVFLLPGFLFFTGFLSAERVSRDTTPRSAIGQLAGTVLVSIISHALGLFLGHLSALLFDFPSPSWSVALGALLAGTPSGMSSEDLGVSMTTFWPWIFAYLVTVSGIGFQSGRVLGLLAVADDRGWKGWVNRRVGFLIEHRWVYQVFPDASRGFAPTYAHLLTRTNRGGDWLLYSGPMYRCGLLPDGRFAYYVLRQPECRVLSMKEDGELKLTMRSPVLGASTAAKLIDHQFLYLDADQVANAFFNRYSVAPTSVDEVERLIAKEDRDPPLAPSAVPN